MAPDSDLQTVAPANQLRESWEHTKNVCTRANEHLTMNRLLDPDSLRAMARGCAVLGAGGGGDTHITLLQALQATEDYGPVPLVDLDELPGDALIMPCGGIGSPTVSIEKLENGNEGARLK